MAEILFLILMCLIAASLGCRVLVLAGQAIEGAVDRLAIAIPMGLGLLALGALGLGELGMMSRAGLGILLLLAAAVGDWPKALQSFRELGTGSARLAGQGTMARLLGVLTVGTVAGTFVTAMAPVTDGDSLCYHLQVPKVFLQQGAVGFDPDLHETVYPLVVEMVDVYALAWSGPVACRLLQWLLGLCLAGAVTGLARPVLGARAWWAGIVALLVPAVSNGMSSSLNDVALATYSAVALLAWIRWLEAPGGRVAVLAGLLGGLALGVKYPALVWVGLLGAIPMVGLAVGPLRRRLAGLTMRQVGIYGLAVVLVGGVWYLRAAMATGNPVYPFFRETFGGAGLAEVLDPIKRPLAVTPWNLLTALIPMTLQPDRFDSFSHQFGPAFLLFLPMLLLFRSPGRVKLLVLFGLTFLTVCLTQRQSMRFVLAATAPLSVGVAWAVSYACESRARAARLLVVAFVLMMACESGLAVARARHGLGAAVGWESRGDYLSRVEPTYGLGRWVEANLPESARLIGQDHRGFYLPRPYTMELAHRRRTGLGSRGEAAVEVVETLRERGYTHLILCPPEPVTAVEFDPTLGHLLEEWLVDRQPLFESPLTDGDGVVRRYAVYELEESSSRLAAGTLEGAKQ